MTDNDIIKALGYCVSHDECGADCPCFSGKLEMCGDREGLLKQCLDLINRQNAEIERLKIMHSEMCIGMKVLKKTTIKKYKEKVIEVLLGKSIFPVLAKNALNETEKKMTEDRENDN